MKSQNKILVVDDEALLREIIVFDLTKAGYKTIEAACGEDAIKIVRNEEVGLVISDVRMPSGTGIQLLDWIRAEDVAKPPFVFLTAFADLSSEEAFAQGAEAFLRKPIDKGELLQTVAQCLEPRKSRWLKNFIDKDGTRFFELINDPLLPETSEVNGIEVGQGGVFVKTANPWPSVFEIIRFRLSIKEHPLNGLEGFGQVRWSRPDPQEGHHRGFGMEFFGFDETGVNLLQSFLTKERPCAYIPLGRVKF